MDLSDIKKIYFIGIGGIGISYLARLMLFMGKEVFGSDLVDSANISDLKKRGAHVIIGPHVAVNITTDFDVVVYNNAIKKTNLELVRARKLGLMIVSHPEFLGQLMANYSTLIVSGTHGKSSTTAMLAKIFIEAGLDPTVVVGTKIKECDNENARLGFGRYFIAEGDEYKEAFLNYVPTGLVITNIEADHLDYYKTEQNVIKAFIKLVKKIPTEGFLIANADDANVQKVIKQARCRIITFGVEHGDYRAAHVVRHGELTRFAVKGLERFDLALKVPGLHNVKNALAACVMALSFGVQHEIIQKALLEYSGAWRRFELKGEKGGVTVIDDYAHHPTEIKATLAAARSAFPGKRVWCIFQPHSGDRTKQLFKDFVTSFADCDQLVVTEIYRVAGREHDTKITSEKLVQEIKKQKKEVCFVKDFRTVPTRIRKKLKPDDVIIIMGAGTITEIADKFLR